MTCVISLCTKILTYNDYIYLYSRRNDILVHDLSTNMTYHRKFNMNNWTVSIGQGLLTRPSTRVDLLLTYLLLFLFVVRFAQPLALWVVFCGPLFLNLMYVFGIFKLSLYGLVYY